MEEIAMMLPVLPGKREMLTAFVDAITGARKAEYDEAQSTIKSESWFVQSTPMGDFVIVHFTAPSIIAVFTGLATADGEFETWYRAQIQAITGVDFAAPPSSLPETIFQWRRAE